VPRRTNLRQIDELKVTKLAFSGRMWPAGRMFPLPVLSNLGSFSSMFYWHLLHHLINADLTGMQHTVYSVKVG
jgi:hypothetical protein